MRESMGRCKGMPGRDEVEQVWVDRGPREYYVPPKDTRPYAWTTFDQSWSGRLPTSIRNTGHHPVYEEDEARYGSSREATPLGYNRPAGDESYLNALHVFFDDAIERIAAKPRQDLPMAKKHLKSLMAGESERDAATRLDISQQAVNQARQRIVAQLVEVFGGKHALAAALRWYLRAEGGRGLEDKLPRWVW